jgi:hypothetical protein
MGILRVYISLSASQSNLESSWVCSTLLPGWESTKHTQSTKFERKAKKDIPKKHLSLTRKAPFKSYQKTGLFPETNYA